MKFYASGKILITAEYAVLGGAKALAIPTKLGQSLEVSKTNSGVLRWESIDESGNTWYTKTFDINTFSPLDGDDVVSQRLQQLFIELRKENPACWKDLGGISFVTTLEFNRSWGLGSSSTLLSLLSQWSGVNPYLLQQNVFGGSGYDVACATATGALLYERTNPLQPKIKTVDFDPVFKDQLFFVHLNQKQDSQQAVAAFDNSKLTTSKINEINALTAAFLNAQNASLFQELMHKHEALVGRILDQKPVQQRYFRDYNGTIKSLGAWGGDFVLACGATTTPAYFAKKGFTTCLAYSSLINAVS